MKSALSVKISAEEPQWWSNRAACVRHSTAVAALRTDDDDTDLLATQVANLFKAVYQDHLQALTRYSVHTRRPTAGLRGWPRRATDELGGQCIESEL